MRRSILRWAMTLAAVLMPAWAMASDQETAQQIADALRGSGQLVDYSIGVKYEEGTAFLLGRVATDEQSETAVAMAQQMPMVRRVVNNLEIKPTRPTKSTAIIKTSAVAEDTESTTSAVKNFFSGKSLNKGQAAVTHVEPAPARNQPSKPADPILAHEAKSNVAPPAGPARGEQAAASRMSKFQSQLKSALGLSNPNPGSEYDTQLTAYEGEAEAVQQTAATRPATQPARTLAPTAPGAPKTTAQRAPLQVAQRAPQQVAAKPSNAPRPITHVARAMNNQAGPIQGNAGAPAPALASLQGTPCYDQPRMPNHAWPSYAAYPNYAGVTYPKQYSPTAWPYIGPFYPYPQVPLGWRRVSLEWDDGWWFLDFSNRRELRHH